MFSLLRKSLFSRYLCLFAANLKTVFRANPPPIP